MNEKLNDILVKIDFLTLEEQETILEIIVKRINEKKRINHIRDVKETEAEYKAVNLKPESVDEKIEVDKETIHVEKEINAIVSVKELLDKLPDHSEYEDIISEIYFKKQVEEGLQQLNKGEYLSHDEVMKKMEKWLK